MWPTAMPACGAGRSEAHLSMVHCCLTVRCRFQALKACLSMLALAFVHAHHVQDCHSVSKLCQALKPEQISNLCSGIPNRLPPQPLHLAAGTLLWHVDRHACPAAPIYGDRAVDPGVRTCSKLVYFLETSRSLQQLAGCNQHNQTVAT